MPRKVRVEFPGAVCHVMSRGDRREDIFLDDVDRQDFLKTLAEACLKTGFQVHAYCLMWNHFHLVVETPNGNLVAGMRWLLSAYSYRNTLRTKLLLRKRRRERCAHKVRAHPKEDYRLLVELELVRNLGVGRR